MSTPSLKPNWTTTSTGKTSLCSKSTLCQWCSSHRRLQNHLVGRIIKIQSVRLSPIVSWFCNSEVRPKNVHCYDVSRWHLCCWSSAPYKFLSWCQSHCIVSSYESDYIASHFNYRTYLLPSHLPHTHCLPPNTHRLLNEWVNMFSRSLSWNCKNLQY